MQTKNIIFFLLLVCCFAQFSYAIQDEVNFYGYFKQGDCLLIKQTCADCTYVNYTVIFKNETLQTNEPMNYLGGGIWTDNFCNTSLIGRYDVAGIGDLGGNATTFDSIWFEITPSGGSIDLQKSLMQTILIPALVAVLALILFSISYVLTNENAQRALRYTGIVIAAFNLYLCFYLGSNDLLFIFSAGLIGFGVISLFE